MVLAKKPKIVSIKERKSKEKEPPSHKTHKFVHTYMPKKE